MNANDQSNYKLIRRDQSFPLKNSVNSAGKLVKFHGSPQQITVNSAVDSQLKENQLCCSKCIILLFVSIHVMQLAFTQMADKDSKQSNY